MRKHKILTLFLLAIFFIQLIDLFTPQFDFIAKAKAYPDIHPDEESIKILLTNDVHLGKSGENYTSVEAYMRNLYNYTAFGKIDFLILGSDLMNTANPTNYGLLRDYIIADLYGGNFPLFIRGNHESDQANYYGRFYNESSYMPSRWAFKYKGVLFIGTTTGAKGGDCWYDEDYQFVKYELESNPGITTILFINEPPYDTTGGTAQNSTEPYGYMLESRYENAHFNFGDFLDTYDQIELIIHFQNHVNPPEINNATWHDTWIYGCSGTDFTANQIPRIKYLKITSSEIRITNYSGLKGIPMNEGYDFNYTVSTSLNTAATDNYFAYGGFVHDGQEKELWSQFMTEQNATLQIIGLFPNSTENILPDPHLQLTYQNISTAGSGLFPYIGTAMSGTPWWNWTERIPGSGDRTVWHFKTDGAVFELEIPSDNLAKALYYLTDYLPFVGGETYNLTIEVKANQTQNNALNFEVLWYGVPGATGTATNDTNYQITTSWANYSCLITAPSNALTGQYRFEFENMSNVEFYVDWISVRPHGQTGTATEDAYLTINGVEYGASGTLNGFESNNYSLPIDFSRTTMVANVSGSRMCMFRIEIPNPKIFSLNRGIYKDGSGWSTTLNRSSTYYFSYLFGIGGTLRVGSEKTNVTQMGSYINTTGTFSQETMQLMNFTLTPYDSWFNLTTTSYSDSGSGNWTIETVNQKINWTFTWNPSNPFVYKIERANLTGVQRLVAYNPSNENMTFYLTGSGTAYVEVNCTSKGEPTAVNVDGGGVSFNYNSSTKICDFNVTFSSTKEIEIEWAEAEGNVAFDTDFDAGNGENFIEASANHWTFQLEVDNPDEKRWFYFKITNNSTERTAYVKVTNLHNSGKCWPVWSTDQSSWTYFDNTTELTYGGGWEGWLEMKINLTSDQVKWVAYHLPYSYSDYITWINSLSSTYLNKTIIGYSAQNRPIYGLEITNFSIPQENKLKFFMQSGEHSEYEAYSFPAVKGAVTWLLNEGNAYATKVRNQSIWYFIPCINPDGYYLGTSQYTAEDINIPNTWNITAWDDHNETKCVVEWLNSSYVGDNLNVAISLHSWETGSGSDGNALFRKAGQNSTAQAGVRAAWQALIDINEEGEEGSGETGFKGFFYTYLGLDCTFTWEIQQGLENGDGDYIQDAFLQELGENMTKGVCNYYIGEEGEDQYPTYSNVGSNNTIAGQSTKLYSYWNDDNGLSKYKVEHNNTGTFVNATGSFGATPAWANETITLNSTIGVVVAWRIHANDTLNQWNTTAWQYITTTSGDITAPTYSNISTNTTLAGNSTQFRCKWTDETNLSGYIFGTNNTGTWVNETWSALGSNPCWANVTKTLNSTVGLVIGYRWWANDTNNNWNNTGIQTLTTTAEYPTVRYYFFWSFKDKDNVDVASKITWTLYNGSTPLIYIQGEATISTGTYTLKTYYQTHLINLKSISTSTQGNSTVTVSLQMKSHTSTSQGYLAFNITVSVPINSQSATNLTFTPSGSGACKMVIDVPKNASYIQKDGVNQTGWTYNNYVIVIETSSLSAWELIFEGESEGEQEQGTAAGVYILVVYVKANGLPVQANITIGNSTKLTDAAGKAVFNLPYGTYYVQVSYMDKNQRMRVLLNSDRSIGFTFSVPIIPNHKPIFILMTVGVISFLGFMVITGRKKPKRYF